MPQLFIDIETYYPTRSVVKAGAHASAEDAEIILLAYALGDGPVIQWSPREGEKMPADLIANLLDPNVTVRALNAMFERVTMKQVLPRMGYHGVVPDVSRWRCDMVLALTKSLPGSLDKMGDIVGLPQDKKKLATGKRLIKMFCGPRTPTANKPWTRSDHTNEPEKWQEFKMYNALDVEAHRGSYLKLGKFPITPDEQKFWELDQLINDKGLPLDVPLIEGALEVAASEHVRLFTELQKITKLANPNSVAQLKEWLFEKGLDLPDMTKLSVSRALETPGRLRKPVKRALEIRQQLSKTSNKKYDALLGAMSSDGTLKGAFQFYGANRTGRWTGKKFQPHNLPRGYKDEADIHMAGELIRAGDPDNWLPLMVGKPMDVLSQCLRSVVRAPEGKKLIVSDLNAIENRVLGWITGCDSILEVFRKGLCPYKDFATAFFGVTYDEVDAAMRTLSKPPVLGCGYMLSGGEEKKNARGDVIRTGLWAYADSMGVDFTKEQSHFAVQLFRQRFVEVVRYWEAVDLAFRNCISTGATTKVGVVRFHKKGPFVCIRLPSGRDLYYYKPTLQLRTPPWELGKKNPQKRQTICYWGQDQQTKQWTEQSTHPGKITENIDQAISRDILATGIWNAHHAGMDVRGHVHDEIIAIADEGDTSALDTLTEIMSADIPWAPGLPLGAAGFECKFYRKD